MIWYSRQAYDVVQMKVSSIKSQFKQLLQKPSMIADNAMVQLLTYLTQPNKSSKWQDYIQAVLQEDSENQVLSYKEWLKDEQLLPSEVS